MHIPVVLNHYYFAIAGNEKPDDHTVLHAVCSSLVHDY